MKTIKDLQKKLWYRALKIVYIFFYALCLLFAFILAISFHGTKGSIWDEAVPMGIVSIILFELIKRAGYYIFLGKAFPPKE